MDIKSPIYSVDQDWENIQPYFENDTGIYWGKKKKKHKWICTFQTNIAQRFKCTYKFLCVLGSILNALMKNNFFKA